LAAIPAAPSQETRLTQLPAIVIGAGPIGLTAALALRARGLPATIIEAEPQNRQRPGSRAIYIHGATLKLLERIRPGLGWGFVRHGLVWPTRRTTYRGREVFSKSYRLPPPDVLPHFTSLPQVVAERVLLDACRETGVQFEWAEPIERVVSGPEGVTLTAVSGHTWQAQYVVAADGARSTVRKQVGIEMEGSRSENTFIIVDVAELDEAPLPLERVFHYEHPAVGGRNVLLVPFKGGWRADLECHPDDDPTRWSEGPGLKKWVGDTLGPRYTERITWVSSYQFLQVLASRFADPSRRVLLVGEAAHLFAPFGARGMNSGVPDADSAAEAVATALEAGDARAAAAAIDIFDSQRRAAAEWNRACAGVALEHLQARTVWQRAKRRTAALLAPIWESAGRWLDEAPYGPRTPPPSAAGGKY
jgi:3-(3-hydroxy-phenyl)propionate hydroxylase